MQICQAWEEMGEDWIPFNHNTKGPLADLMWILSQVAFSNPEVIYQLKVRVWGNFLHVTPYPRHSTPSSAWSLLK